MIAKGQREGRETASFLSSSHLLCLVSAAVTMAQFKFRCQSEALPTLSKAEVRTQLDKWSLGDTLRCGSAVVCVFAHISHTRSLSLSLVPSAYEWLHP